MVAFEVNAYKKHEVIQFLMNYLFTDESGGVGLLTGYYYESGHLGGVTPCTSLILAGTWCSTRINLLRRFGGCCDG